MIYEVQINSLCPPQAYLRLEAHDEHEAADLTRRFLSNGSADDFEKALRVLHLPFDDAIGIGQYEIDSICFPPRIGANTASKARAPGCELRGETGRQTLTLAGIGDRLYYLYYL